MYIYSYMYVYIYIHTHSPEDGGLHVFFLHQFEGQHQPLGLVSCWASEEAGILRLDQLGTHEFQDVSRCFMVVL